MAEFSIIEQQKMLFSSQCDSAKKDRNTILILSIFLGGWGIDRFMIGDIGMGVLKLLTFGLCGVLWLIDLFLIRGKVDEYNRKKANEIISGIKITSQ